MNITALRLQNQNLTAPAFANPHDVVAHYGAVQAQDYAMAKWGLALRIPGATDVSIEQACNQGAVLRTHVMRPTWHFVAPENIRWLVALTAPRVHAVNSHMYRRLELDGELLVRCHDVFVDSMQGNAFLTRDELGKRLESDSIPAKGQRLAYIVMHAELEGLICSGPRLGKQFTYALLEERAPKAAQLDRDEALAKLARLYFTSHGPAQVQDFAWWSGLGPKDAKNGLEMIKPELVNETIHGKAYWFAHGIEAPNINRLRAFLLSIYDEYTIAYRDRSALGEERTFERLILMGNALTAVVIHEGKIIGTWKRETKKNGVEIKLNAFKELTSGGMQAVKNAADRYGAFMGLSASLS